MKLIEFNLAVLSYCQKMGVTDLRNRFTQTIDGQNILYTQLSRDTSEQDNAFEIAETLGLVPTCKSYIFAEVEDIPSEFEEDCWQIPTIYKEPSGEISTERVIQVWKFRGLHAGSFVLYNDNFIAYCIEHKGVYEMGYLRKKNEEWGGFGEYSRQEFIQWLIKKGHIPV